MVSSALAPQGTIVGPRLWVGLGNPGKEYAKTRHNIGFMAIDALATHLSATPFRQKFSGEWAEVKKRDAETGEAGLYLFKPQRFMNRSGPPVAEAASFYKIPPSSIVVFHDELDLPLAKVRIKQGGGAAGHNGLRSLDAAIGPDYFRVRLGIGHPGAPERVEGYVLSPFAADEQETVEQLLSALVAENDGLLAGDYARLQNNLALRLQPAKPATLKPAKEG